MRVRMFAHAHIRSLIKKYWDCRVSKVHRMMRSAQSDLSYMWQVNKTWMRLLTWVYNQYIKAILRKLEVLLGFILYNFSNIRCRWHRDDDRIRRQTAGNSKQGSKRKRKERIDYQLEECRIHCCLEEEQMPKHSVVYSNAWNESV